MTNGSLSILSLLAVSTVLITASTDRLADTSQERIFLENRSIIFGMNAGHICTPDCIGLFWVELLLEDID
jgi:hypothetical protein